MDKKLVIKEVIELADKFENKGMVSIANRVTDIAVRLAYDFNNPEKEDIVDRSLALEDNPTDEKGSSHWYDDEEDSNDDSDKIDFSNIFKELFSLSTLQR